ncbi:MAG: HU family DNA-binding protein [bacterium]
MNKEELVKEVAKKTKMSQKEVAEIIGATVEMITKTVSKGKKVTLVGFGTFEARKRAARTGRNPQTGAELKIAAKTVPAFSAGKKFKEIVNPVKVAAKASK